MQYEKGPGTNSHLIESMNTMTCSETGRVIAAFYTEADLDLVLRSLNDIRIEAVKDAIDWAEQRSFEVEEYEGNIREYLTRLEFNKEVL